MKMNPRALSILTIALCVTLTQLASANPRLAKKVSIRRTEFGVPHILAENERAMGFGLAYAQAEDHIVTIMKLIIRARGESAIYLGGTPSNISSDFSSKQYRIYARAKETFKDLDRDWQEVTEGYAQGLNYYIELHRDELPDFVRPVTKYDVAAHGLTGVARFAIDRGGIVRKIKSKLADGKPVLVNDEDNLDGSNMWAFTPERTTTGNAILMGNPHQSWSEVATYYEAHVTIPGKLNFYGSTFIGRPVLTTGFNEHLGWTHTVNYPDIEEVYAFDIDPDDSNRYILDGTSHPITSETVSVEYSDPYGVDVSDSRKFLYTQWGPVVHIDEDMVYVHRPTAFFEYRYYQHWYRLGMTTNFEAWKRELDTLIMPMFNTGYADADGNIYYRWNGSIPKLPEGSHQDEVVHATSSSQIWTEHVVPDDLPQLKNPQGGYIMNSNSAPYHTNLHEVMDPADFPDYFPAPRFSFRSQHSMYLVHNDRKFSLDDVVTEKFSQRAILAERVKDDLLNALADEKLNNLETQAVSLLENWDDRTTRESQGSVIFQEWINRYRSGKKTDELFAQEWDFDNPIETPDGLADPIRVVEAFREAVTDVVKKWGSIDVSWGDVHRIRFGDKVDLPIGGAGNDMGAFRVLGYKEDSDGKRRARTGDSWVFAVDFAETPKAYSVVAYSQSGREESPHFADQAAMFADNRMKQVSFT
jgi:acyl-homoserine-lactone acylase